MKFKTSDNTIYKVADGDKDRVESLKKLATEKGMSLVDLESGEEIISITDSKKNKK